MESNFWQQPAGLELQQHLDEVYKHFRAWLRAKKIPCSQGPFTVKSVPWLPKYDVDNPEVQKANGEAFMVMKAYNARVVTEYASCASELLLRPNAFDHPLVTGTHVALNLGLCDMPGCAQSRELVPRTSLTRYFGMVERLPRFQRRARDLFEEKLFSNCGVAWCQHEMASGRSKKLVKSMPRASALSGPILR